MPADSCKVVVKVEEDEKAKDWESFIDGLMPLAPWYKRWNWILIKWKLALARRWLRKYDPIFSVREHTMDLVVRRERARKKGIGPGDPRYPTLYD